VGLREGAEEPLRRLQRAADLAAMLARRFKTGHVALISVTDLWGALEVGTPPYAPLKPPRDVQV
jgi:CRISPR-associated protein Cas2